MSDERLAFCWNSHAVIGAAWSKYATNVIVDQLPGELGLLIPQPSEPWTHVVWLHGELWYSADWGDAVRRDAAANREVVAGARLTRIRVFASERRT